MDFTIADEFAAKCDPNVRDDSRQACIVALLELNNNGVGDPEQQRRACQRAIDRIVKRTHETSREFRWMDEYGRPFDQAPPPPRRTSRSQVGTARQLVIAAALSRGISQRTIATAMKCSQSYVAKIRKCFVIQTPTEPPRLRRVE